MLVWWLHAEQLSRLDVTAARAAREVAAGIAEDGLPGALLPPSADPAVRIQVVDATGRVLARTPTPASGPASAGAAAGPVPAPAAEGQDRVATARVPGRAGPLTVDAAIATVEADQTSAELAAALLTGGPLLLALLAVTGWVLVGRALRPVEALRRHTAAITATDRHQRVVVPAAHDEIRRLAITLNALLDSLAAATDQHRQFVADAAHELRSPLATLTTQIEVATAHPDHTDWTALAPELLVDLTRLGRLVDELVHLARLDAAPSAHREPVDLDDLVLTAARRARAAATTLTVETRGVGPAQLLADPAGLEHIVANLLDNAVRYAATTVTLAVTQTSEHAELTVADDGPGVPAEDRRRVFDRFTRLDPARGHDTGGAGLGLAIVAALTDLHHGQVWIEDTHPGARLRLRLPCGRGAGPPGGRDPAASVVSAAVSPAGADRDRTEHSVSASPDTATGRAPAD